MATVAKFFLDKGDAINVAVKIGKTPQGGLPDIYYCELPPTATVPASVFVWAHCKDIPGVGKVIYTNYPRTWVSTNSDIEFRSNSPAKQAKADMLLEYANAIKVSTLATAPWSKFTLDKLGAPPALDDIYSEVTTVGESKARRLYLLAAFSILKKYGRKAKSEDRHNIGSILVSKTGTILSWGVNTGGFCHAEVNSILAYFANNPGVSRLPANSVLFSTLKPCAMCCQFIIEAQHKGSDVKVWYGMNDEGGKGSSALLKNNSTHFKEGEELGPDMEEFWNPESTPTSPFTSPNRLVEGTKPVHVKQGPAKVDLFNTLNATGGGAGVGRNNQMAAQWVDSSDDVWKLVEAASTKLAGKADKAGRKDGAIKKTLDYIKNWFR